MRLSILCICSVLFGVLSCTGFSAMVSSIPEEGDSFYWKDGKRSLGSENMGTFLTGEQGFLPLRFMTREDFFNVFSGKWLFFAGDSNTRFMVLSLLQMLDVDGIRPADPNVCSWWEPADALRMEDCLRVGVLSFVFRKGGASLARRFVRDTHEVSMDGVVDAMPVWREERARGGVFVSFVMTTQTPLVKSVVGLPEDWAGWFGTIRPDAFFFATGAWDHQVLNQTVDFWRERARRHVRNDAPCASSLSILGGAANVPVEKMMAWHRAYIGSLASGPDGDRRRPPVVWGTLMQEKDDPVRGVLAACQLFAIQRRLFAPGGDDGSITGLVDRYALTARLPGEWQGGPHYSHIVNQINVQGVLRLFQAQPLQAAAAAAVAEAAAAEAAAAVAVAAARQVVAIAVDGSRGSPSASGGDRADGARLPYLRRGGLAQEAEPTLEVSTAPPSPPADCMGDAAVAAATAAASAAVKA
ncbi:unnamed protein product, partial [Phaeothamnion confervicola]